MKTITIDFDYLIFVYQDDSPDNIYYLDTEYGDIRLVHRQLDDLRDLTDEIEINHERFLYIPKASKEELLITLKDFSHNIKDKQLKQLLEIAFESPHVLDSFKKILNKYPQEREEFDKYLHDKSQKNLLSWLNANALSVG